LQKLYPTHQAYVAKVDADLASRVQQHLLLSEDAKSLHEEASKAQVP
jgi:hypothetical protein